MEAVKLKLSFCCTTADPLAERSRETLYICSPLSDAGVGEVKAIIQRDHGIPTCVQRIKWAGSTLNEGRSLRSYGLEENDELEVVYHSKGDCNEIEESVQWLKEVVLRLRNDGVPDQRNFVEATFSQLAFTQQETHLRCLWAELFQPWHEPKKYTNKLYFVVLGGVDLLIELHSLVLCNKWEESPDVLKYTEFLLLHVFWSFGETFSLQRLAIKNGVMDLFLKSIGRLEVIPGEEFRDRCVTGEQWVSDGVPNLNDIADGALGVLSNFCELTEGREFLASKPDTLNHLLSIMTNQGFSPPVIVSISEVMMQVSNDVRSHRFLSQEHVVQVLLHNPFFLDDKRHEPKYECLSKYFAMQCLARVLLTSPQLLSWVETTPTNKTTILSTIETLTLNQTLCDITKYEDEAGYLWYTLIPNVAVLFRPLLDSNSGLFKLQIAAQKLFVATLQVILGRKGHDHVLISEGLVDYIVCLPWWSQTSGVRERSKQLLTLIRQSPDIHYEPPSLLNMSKAAVSVYYCGLDNVMKLSVVPELVWKILQQHQFLKHEIH